MARGKRDKDGLTPLQRLFCDNYLNRDNTDTFHNGTQSYINAGYSVNSRNAAHVNSCKLLSTDTVKAYIDKKMADIERKVVFTTVFLDSQLELALADCVKQGDNTNRLATLRLIGQRLSAYTDKQISAVIEPEPDIDDLDALLEQAKEFKRLASIPAEYRQIASRDVTACFTSNTGLLQGDSECVGVDRADDGDEIQDESDD